MHIWTVKHFSVYKMVAYYVTYCKHIGFFFTLQYYVFVHKTKFPFVIITNSPLCDRK